MFELLASSPFVYHDTLIPTLPADAFMTTNERINMIAALCFITGYLVRAIIENYRRKKGALPCSN